MREKTLIRRVERGGPDRDRTGDLRRVKPTFRPSHELSNQLNYRPKRTKLAFPI